MPDSLIWPDLIAAGDIPPMVGLFVDPGVFANTTASNRSFTYDTLSDQYARFLLDEMLPEVAREQPLRQDAEWVASPTSRVDQRSVKVDATIRSSSARCLPSPSGCFCRTVRMTSITYGNWGLANLQMVSALQFAGYDYTFVGGHGFHSLDHGRAILADSLR